MGFNTKSEKQSGLGSGAGVTQSISGTDIWGQQIPHFANMFNQATGLANSQASAAPQHASGLVAGMSPHVNNAMSSMSNIASGGSPIEAYAQPNNALAARQLSDMTDQISTQFGRSILPQLRTGAGLAGGMGGSREALARGVAAGDAAGAIGRAGTDLYAQQYQTGANAAAAATDARMGAAGAIPGMAGEAFNLGMAPFQAAWAPLAQLMQILGNPQVLQRSVQTGINLDKNTSAGKSSGMGFNLF